MRKIVRIIIIIGIIYLSTGCVKYNATVNINKNKSINFRVIYALDKSLIGKEKLLKQEDKKNLEKQGFTIEDYSENNMKGYTIKIDIPNIDKISTSESIIYDLASMFSKDSKNNKIFTIKRGILKNTYKANFKFDSKNSNLNNYNQNNKDNNIDEWGKQGSIFGETEDNDIDSNMDDDLNKLINNMDLSFKVNLPYSAIKNNATQTSNENKELVWMLTNENKNIEFEFSLYNRINITILSIIVFLLIIFSVIIIIKKNKDKSNKQNNDELNINKFESNNELNKNINMKYEEQISNSSELVEELVANHHQPTLTHFYNQEINMNKNNNNNIN